MRGVGGGVDVGLGVAVATSTLGVDGGTGVIRGVVVGKMTTRGISVGVGIGVAVGSASRTNLTMTIWVAFMSIFAVLPDTLKTGPTHSSNFQPCFGRTEMVTVLPEI